MILITGSKGQLGQAVTEEARQRGISYTALDRSSLNVSNRKAVDEYFKACEGQFDCLINCGAYTAVDAAEDSPGEAYASNSYSPWVLSQTGIPILHVSTDYVFDGTGSAPYHVDAHCKPISVYGLSKRAGETALLEAETCGAIVRTAWVYSSRPDTKNFYQTIHRLAKTQEKLKIVDDQIGTPTLAEDLAAVLLDLYEKGAHKHPMHMLHFTNAGISSWYEFAKAIVEASGLTVKLEPIPSSSYPTKALRPKYSALDLSEIERLYKIRPRHWYEALRDAIHRIY